MWIRIGYYRLLQYSWPGNARELENLVERALVLSHGPMMTVDDLPQYFSADGASAHPVQQSVFRGETRQAEAVDQARHRGRAGFLTS